MDLQKKTLQKVRLTGSGPKGNYFSEILSQQTLLTNENKNETIKKCTEKYHQKETAHETETICKLTYPCSLSQYQ